MFMIWKYTLSAFCSYFYSPQGPSGGSEKSYMLKKVPKRFKSVYTPPLRVSKTRDIMPSAKQVYRHSWIYTFWVRFLLIGTFLSPQIRSGSYKNSQRKLRHYSTRSDNFHDNHLKVISLGAVKKWRQEFFPKIDSRGGSDLWVKNSWLFLTFFLYQKNLGSWFQ